MESIVDVPLQRFDRVLTDALIRQSRAHIAKSLRAGGIDQEGRRISVSLIPTVLDKSELDSVAVRGRLIRSVLIELIEAFVAEHNAGRTNGPLHGFFAPYAKWWDLIATEVRHSDHVQLMRYDTARQDDGRWRILESNTCCPAGVVHCAMIRRAWLRSPLGCVALEDGDPVEYPVDEASSFVEHLVRVAQSASGNEAPNLAICSYRGVYSNELRTIRRVHAALRDAGEIPPGDLLLGDVRDIECTDGGPAFLRGRPIDLVYNKLDPLAIDPGDRTIAGWLAAARSPRVEFLNSLGAMYLSEAKRSLAFLHDDATRAMLPTGPVAAAAIEEHIPWTRCLPDPAAGADGYATMRTTELPALWLDRHRYVLKPDALTRGEGIAVGANLTPDEWLMAIVRGIGEHGIAQELVAIPTRPGYRGPDGEPAQRQYWGVDLMYYGAEFAGPVSRSHHQMVINVGAGGSESPTIVLGNAMETRPEQVANWTIALSATTSTSTTYRDQSNG
ncbi:MAG TPA: hypothetical protein VFR22_10285 [Nocardioidaceae bacterium]|nr:hypothetical protein [Nocardioidaceae bacterium]